MYRVLSASYDTYITDKIIRGTGFRATDANVGQSGTLDLFKLYGETATSIGSDLTELSRILIKFNMHPLRSMVSKGDLDLNNMKAELVLSDIYGGQTTPNNFKLISFPLAQKFQEGIGRDVVNYNDLGTSNFVASGFDIPMNLIGQHAFETIGYLLAFFSTFPSFLSSIIKFLFYSFAKKKLKKNIYKMRFLGLLNSYFLKKSFYRPKIF